MGPPGDAGVPAAQEERQAAASSYSQALRDRLHRIRAEMEAQGALALRLRRSLEGARAEVEKNSRELYELRVRWTEEEPSRAELLRETGEVERRLSERERRCAEALVQLAERDQAPGAAEAAPPPAGRAAPTSPHGATAALRGDAYDDDFEQEEDGEEGRRRARLAQERQRLAGLESRRLELVSELGRLRELSAQEAASVEQLSERIEAIRKEARTARTLARASREREERSKQKIEASTATAAASRQRQRALESQVADLGTEIDVLRGELAAVAQPAVGAAASGGPAAAGAVHARARARAAAPGPPPPDAAEGGAGAAEAAVASANLKLQAKVSCLREELLQRQAAAQRLRCRPGAAAGAGEPPPAAGSQFWASCSYDCKPGVDWASNWTCEELGERAEDGLGCAWSGKACTFNKLCCHEGQRCVRKNAMEAYCSHEEPPEDWDGEVIGGCRNEYIIPPAPEDEARGTSLFCFMAVLPGSIEEGLRDLAAGKGASIFACDASACYGAWQTDRAVEGTWDSVVNTEVFKSVWYDVQKDGQYMSHDWVVKVDPDSVFFPDRLKSHLWALHAPKEVPIYIKNTDRDFGFLGAIEVFSKEAVDKLFWPGVIEACAHEVGEHSGEDGFMKGCMDMIGAGAMEDIDVLRTPAAEDCGDARRVCFHAFKDPASWEGCYNAAAR